MRADLAPATPWELLEMTMDAHDARRSHLAGILYKMWLDRRDALFAPKVVSRKRRIAS
jgi:hypothetical protein